MRASGPSSPGAGTGTLGRTIGRRDGNAAPVTTGSKSLQNFCNYENYLGRQVPLLWMPEVLLQVSAVNQKLIGWSPQPPQLNITPETWKFTS